MFVAARVQWLIARSLQATESVLGFALERVTAWREKHHTIPPRPIHRRHLWDIFEEPQRCLYCPTERSLETEEQSCSGRFRHPRRKVRP